MAKKKSFINVKIEKIVKDMYPEVHPGDIFDMRVTYYLISRISCPEKLMLCCGFEFKGDRENEY